MKKSELIAKAKERNITLTEEQADKYKNLSDEELENIAGAADRVVVKFDPAETCKYFDPKKPEYDSKRLCENCTYDYVEYAGCFGKVTTHYCTKQV